MYELGIGSINIDPIMDLVPLAKAADRAGFSSFWVPDNAPSLTFRDCYVTLSALALNTSQIRLGPGISPIYTRHPVYLAVAANAIQELSKGRFILGVGPGGNMTLAPFKVPIWDKPIKYVREAVELINKLQTGETVSWDNPYFKCTNVQLRPKPSPRFPLYLSARGAQMTKLSGKIADGVLLTAPAEAIKHSVDLVKEGAKEAKRSPKKIKIVNQLITYFGAKIDPKAKARIKTDLGFMIANTTDDIHEMTKINLEDVDKVRKALNTKGPEESRKLVTEEMLQVYTLTGTMDECLERTMQFFKKGVDELVVSDPLGPDPLKTIKKLGKDFIPHLKS